MTTPDGFATTMRLGVSKPGTRTPRERRCAVVIARRSTAGSGRSVTGWATGTLTRVAAASGDLGGTRRLAACPAAVAGTAKLVASSAVAATAVMHRGEAKRGRWR